MICATLGMVSKVDAYDDKKTGALVRTAYVATGEHMISVRLSEEEQFEELDVVVVCGELKTFERRFYINGGKIRLATSHDREFFKMGAAAPHSPVSSSPNNGALEASLVAGKVK